MTRQSVPFIRYRLEYVLFRACGACFALLPYRLALALGWMVAWVGYVLVRYRVRTVHARIREVFPDADPARVRRIAWLSWRHFMFNLVDMFRLDRINEAWMRRYLVDYDDTVRRVRESLSHGGGAVGVSLHMDSAEVSAVCLQRLGVPVFVISGRQKNPLVDARLNAMRAGTGIACIPKSAGTGLLKQVFRRLKQGGVLTMLVDLRMAEGGVDVDFLGARASVVPGMGLFARNAGVPVIPSLLVREGWTRHRMILLPPLFPDERLERDADIQRLTQTVFKGFEARIREQPEQWFWYNKNWILAPPRSSAAPGPPTGGAA